MRKTMIGALLLAATAVGCGGGNDGDGNDGMDAGTDTDTDTDSDTDTDTNTDTDTDTYTDTYTGGDTDTDTDTDFDAGLAVCDTIVDPCAAIDPDIGSTCGDGCGGLIGDDCSASPGPPLTCVRVELYLGPEPPDTATDDPYMGFCLPTASLGCDVAEDCCYPFPAPHTAWCDTGFGWRCDAGSCQLACL